MATITSAQSGLASAASTWVGGVVPVEGDKVNIAVGHVVTLDGAYIWGDDAAGTTITTGAINVSGTLKASRLVSSSLTAKGVINLYYTTHALDYGTDEDPIPDGVVAEMVLNKAATPAYRAGIRQLTIVGAGAHQKSTFVGSNIRKRGVPLAANTVAANPVINLAQADHGWKVGDELLFFTTTDNTNTNECEVRTISAISVGDARIVTLSSALTYIHKAGSPAANLTCNVILRPHNTLASQNTTLAFHVPNQGTAILGHTLHMKNVRINEMGTAAVNQAMLDLGGQNPNSGLDYQFYRNVFYNSVTLGGCIVQTPSARFPVFEECVFFNRGTCFYQGRPVILKNCWMAVGVISNGAGPGYTIDGCWITGVRDQIILTLPSGSKVLNTVLSGVGVSALDTAAVGVTLENCDLGYTYGWKRYYGQTGIAYFNSSGYAVADSIVKDCLLHAANSTASNSSDMSPQSDSCQVLYINKNNDPTSQAVNTRRGWVDRENTIKNRGSSSVALTPISIGAALTRTASIFCAAGKTIRVVGYVRMNAAFRNGGDFTAPTVTLSGLGAVPVTFSVDGAADTWHKFDLTITSAVAYDGSFLLTYSATPKAVTTGAVYFDGVADAPFVTKTRHFGFLFDEAVPTRTVNPVVQVSEAVAAAYTGVTVDALAPKIAVGAGTVDTWRKLYDWYQAWACANVDKDALLTSGDGINFSLPLTCKLEWGGMPAAGTLSGGWLQLAAPGVHSYSLSGSKIDFMAAGTYNMSGTQFSGTVELVNSSGGAVVVQAPVGVSYTNTGPNITVELPSLDVVVSAPALISGSRVQLYNLTDDVEVLNAELVSAGMTYTAPFTSNKIMRLRADHASKLPLETVGVLTASGLTFLDVQAEDDVYLGNGIDGGAVSEFAPDGANIQVDINDPDGVTNIQRLYAWLQWYMTTEEGVRSAFFGAVSAIDSANYVINQTKADIRLDNVAAFPVRVVGGYLSRRDGSTVIAPLSHSIQMDPGKAYAIETGVSGLTADEGNKLNQISLLALETTAQSAVTAAAAAAVQAAEAADNTTTLLGQSAPTAAAVAAAVWSDAKAGTLALEVTTQEALAAAELAASRGADLLAQPAPTVEAITDGVWSAVDALALEATADAAMQAAELAASRTAELLTRPALTADAIAEGVWTATADTHDAAGSMGAVINSVSDLALESTAQAAASNAALAAALSA